MLHDATSLGASIAHKPQPEQVNLPILLEEARSLAEQLENMAARLNRVAHVLGIGLSEPPTPPGKAEVNQATTITTFTEGLITTQNKQHREISRLRTTLDYLEAFVGV